MNVKELKDAIKENDDKNKVYVLGNGLREVLACADVQDDETGEIAGVAFICRGEE